MFWYNETNVEIVNLDNSYTEVVSPLLSEVVANYICKFGFGIYLGVTQT